MSELPATWELAAALVGDDGAGYEEYEAAVNELLARIAELEAENERLRGQVKWWRGRYDLREAEVEKAEDHVAEQDIQIVYTTCRREQAGAALVALKEYAADGDEKLRQAEAALAERDRIIEALEELVEELDPHHLKRNRMGLRARTEEGGRDE